MIAWGGLLGSIFGFLSVALGAFGAHVLKDRLSAYEMDVFQTANHYLSLHAVLLVGLAVLSQVPLLPEGTTKILTQASALIAAGCVVFSGSLYLLVLTGVKTWGAVTPLGGLMFLLGWLRLILCFATWIRKT